MKRILGVVIVLIALMSFLVIAQEDVKYYGIVLSGSGDSISIESFSLVSGPSRGSYDEAKYTIRLFSYSGIVLYEDKFDFNPRVTYAAPREWFDEESNQVVFSDGNEASPGDVVSYKTIFVPYFVNGKEIAIFEGDKELDRIDVGKYATCNENGVCDSFESFDICNVDCVQEEVSDIPIGDQLSKDRLSSGVLGRTIALYFVGILAVIVAIIIGVIVFLKKRKNVIN